MTDLGPILPSAPDPQQVSSFGIGPDQKNALGNYLYNYPYERYVVPFNFETAGRYMETVNGAAAGATFDNTPLDLSTGTDTTGNDRVRCQAFNAAWTLSIFDRYPILQTVFSTSGQGVGQTADAYIVFGVIDSGAPSYVSKHFGIKIGMGSTNTLYASVADGTTQKLVDITPSGWSATAWTTVRAILVPRKGLAVWINGNFVFQRQDFVPYGQLDGSVNPIATVGIRATAGTTAKHLKVGPLTASFYLH